MLVPSKFSKTRRLVLLTLKRLHSYGMPKMQFPFSAFLHTKINDASSVDVGPAAVLLQAPGSGKQHQYSNRQTRRAGRQALHVCSSAQEVVGVLIFSALPFTAVQALADSSLGKSLRVGPQPFSKLLSSVEVS